MTRARLLLVPQSFPFGVYADFLRDEIEHLARWFDDIVVAPWGPRGDEQPTPDNVSVDLTLAQRIASRSQRMAPAIRTSRGRRLVASDLRRVRSSRAFGALLAAAGSAVEVERWARLVVADGVPTLGLTVWLGAPTLGVASAGIPTVSRAHRGDLFAEHQRGGYLPLQREQVAACRAVYSVSDAGTAYLRRTHPAFAERIATRRLGTLEPTVETRRSSDGVLRVVSCSSLTTPKRPLLLAATIEAVGRLVPRVEWHHFGTGAMAPEFAEATRSLPASVRLVAHGQVPNATVLEHYRTSAVDLFVNVSDSEGVPVSMMEAASYGIPIVATDAGGVREIVGPDTGRLLAVEATAGEIAEAIVEVASSPDGWPARTVTAAWKRSYSAAQNYESFARELRAILDAATGPHVEP